MKQLGHANGFKNEWACTSELRVTGTTRDQAGRQAGRQAGGQAGGQAGIQAGLLPLDYGQRSLSKTVAAMWALGDASSTVVA